MHGERIRFFRRQAGMTQYDLAQKVGRSAASICLYEQEERDIPLSVLIDIARALEVDPNCLLVEQGRKEGTHG